MTLYHLSMGYQWPNPVPSNPFTGTLYWGAVEVGTPNVLTNFNNLNAGDQIEFYVYDLNNSGTTPSPATSGWINIVANDPSYDPTLFDNESFINTGMSLVSQGSLHSLYFAGPPWNISGTVPCFRISQAQGKSSQVVPYTATVDNNTSDSESGNFSVTLTITATDGTNVGTFTSQDPTMIVDPG